MGFFGKKKKGDNDAGAKGASTADHVLPEDDSNLPVAHAVTSEIPMGSPPPAKAPKISNVQGKQEPILQQQQEEKQKNKIPSIFLTRLPLLMDHCPCCEGSARTRVVTFPNWVTWSMVAVLFFLCWPLCWVPLVFAKVSIPNE